MKEKQRILNRDIKAKEVQVITNDWENIGTMSLNDALKKANELGLDLMQIWDKWDTAIVKMLDYGKFLYRQKKQDQKNKQKGKAPEMKTLRITFKIWDHDLEIRRKQAEKFWAALHPLRVTLMLRWRENHYWELAMKKMEAFVESLEETYKQDGVIKRSGNIFSVMLKPKK